MKNNYLHILNHSEETAIKELLFQLKQNFKIDNVILFGSAARNEKDDESDIDILIITKQPYNRAKRHQITDLVFEINLKYNTNISTIVIDKKSWEKGPVSVLPIKDEINQDGIYLINKN